MILYARWSFFSFDTYGAWGGMAGILVTYFGQVNPPGPSVSAQLPPLSGAALDPDRPESGPRKGPPLVSVSAVSSPPPYEQKRHI